MLNSPLIVICRLPPLMPLKVRLVESLLLILIPVKSLRWYLARHLIRPNFPADSLLNIGEVSLTIKTILFGIETFRNISLQVQLSRPSLRLRLLKKEKLMKIRKLTVPVLSDWVVRFITVGKKPDMDQLV